MVCKILLLNRNKFEVLENENFITDEVFTYIITEIKKSNVIKHVFSGKT